MSDDVQRHEAEQRRRFGIPQGVDPRRMMDAAAMEKMLKAQAIARAEAQAATTVIIATIVSLVTSAFSFIAALAWNEAIQALLNGLVTDKVGSFTLSPTAVKIVYAIAVTFIAIVVILIVNRFAGDLAKKSAIAAAANS
jgi:uncharacterized protein DUF5654